MSNSFSPEKWVKSKIELHKFYFYAKKVEHTYVPLLLAWVPFRENCFLIEFLVHDSIFSFNKTKGTLVEERG